MKELNLRIYDLVRFMRHELHQEGLITDEEYAELAGDSGSVKRLDDYDIVIQKSREAAASKRPSGLVDSLIKEIIDLNKRVVDWKSTFMMYRNAWLREIGGVIRNKSHEIDGFVLRTKDVIAEAEKRGRSEVTRAQIAEAVEFRLNDTHYHNTFEPDNCNCMFCERIANLRKTAGENSGS